MSAATTAREVSRRDQGALWMTARVPFIPAPGPGGYFDASSYLGEWPARRVNGSPPPRGEDLVAQRLARMDRLGIRVAAVSSLEAVWLKDSSVANAELHALLGGHAHRCFPMYTLNPAFPAWEDHLERCRTEYGLAAGRGAIRLHPNYHVYSLGDPRLAACLDRLAALDLPVVLTIQLEDARLHQPAMRVPDLLAADVIALISRWPQLRWIVAGPRFVEAQAIARVLAASPDLTRVWIELSRVQGPIDGIPQLCQIVGAQRLLFGTNAPLHVAESAVMELADARLSPADDAAIRYRNAGDALAITLPDPVPQAF